MTILWLKTLHLFFMVAWMAGLFYLPRIFVYHAQATHPDVIEQFKTMERRLWYFVTPFAVLTLVFGVALISSYGREWFRAASWLHHKILLVMFLYAYHVYLYIQMRKFASDENKHSARFYRFLNETPVLILLAIIGLAVIKP